MGSRPAKSCARSRAGIKGRFEPFSLLTDLSELRPTTNTSPNFLLDSNTFRCPTCTRSKHPFVKTIFLRFLRAFLRAFSNALHETIFFVFNFARTLLVQQARKECGRPRCASLEYGPCSSRAHTGSD